MLEKNKIRSYLAYAIGEIFLVVIGILIAVQINNWNENRKKEDIKRSYTSSLINDFRKDSLALGIIITQLERDSLILADIQNRLQDKALSVEKLAQMFRTEFPFYMRSDYSFNNTTLIQLIESNTVNYPTYLRESFASLIKIQEDSQRTNAIFLDKYFDLLNSNESYPFENYFFDSGKHNRDSIWNNIDKVKFLAHFERIADWKMAYTHVILDYARGIQSFTIHLKRELKKLD